jgi:Spy/CpxP family protein refolding chaperone
MKARNIILTITAAILLAVPGTLFAQGPPGGGHGQGPCGGGQGPGGGAWGHGAHGGGFGGGPGGGLGLFDRMLPHLAEHLELSDEQLAEIQAILDEAQPQIEIYAEQLQASRQAYREANTNPAIFDEGAFRTHAAEQSQIQIELMVLTQNTRAKAFAVLTPEQLSELEEMRGNFGNRFKRGSGRRAPR